MLIVNGLIDLERFIGVSLPLTDYRPSGSVCCALSYVPLSYPNRRET